jgi:hypothetical protein
MENDEIIINLRPKHFKKAIISNDVLFFALNEYFKESVININYDIVSILSKNSKIVYYKPQYLNMLNSTYTWNNLSPNSCSELNLTVQDLIKRVNKKKKVGIYQVKLVKILVYGKF